MELTLRTQALPKDTKVRVLLPTGYQATRIPGAVPAERRGGSWLDWTSREKLSKTTAATPAIVVMPDGGQGGNYTDWFGNDGSGKTPRWESLSRRPAPAVGRPPLPDDG